MTEPFPAKFWMASFYSTGQLPAMNDNTREKGHCFPTLAVTQVLLDLTQTPSQRIDSFTPYRDVDLQLSAVALSIRYMAARDCGYPTRWMAWNNTDGGIPWTHDNETTCSYLSLFHLISNKHHEALHGNSRYSGRYCLVMHPHYPFHPSSAHRSRANAPETLRKPRFWEPCMLASVRTMYVCRHVRGACNSLRQVYVCLCVCRYMCTVLPASWTKVWY